ncbi:HugZ family pyridoxamine 5'-phosphate oxidase [Azospirillum rugosum]|uniref:Heme iron utilization protein n=1 Tax=Azospirillum rugosum TaxID=416170 RepID=A0ABS4SUV4_9PROT|nr:DUF2470 domain-containing protein [Azospirillum rugosum]MBP2296339.1 putative heme iron utilization protein [Azospirillum rugosum]MDQ0529860.1 putative heme iron utilization protein [Azospirillum rugosum]
MSSDQPSNAGGPSGPPSGPAPSASSDASPAMLGDAARRVMRAVDRAALATALGGALRGDHPAGELGGWPYPSLVQVALDLDGTPLLLLSTLADHTKNIAADPRVGLLFDGTAGLAQPLAGSRVSVLGRAERSEEPRHRARFLARHPAASFYAGFGDFAIYAVSVERAHHVAGFGRVHWIERADLLPYGVPAALAEAEGDILAHMNADHADAVRLYATVLAGVSQNTAEEGWTMTGLDPDGCDLRCGGTIARVDFDQRVDDPMSARVNLAGLARRARQPLSSAGNAGAGTGSPRL